MHRLPLTTLSAVCLTVVFCAFTTASILYYPYDWSPLTTFLSDFGNVSRSPSGGLIYNAGCIMTAVAAVAFYIGLGELEAGPLLSLGRILGIGSGVALCMIGIFSEDFPPQHRFWSYFFFTVNFFAILISNISLMGRIGRMTIIMGFSLSTVTFISFIFWGGAPIVEWFTVFASIIYALMLGYDVFKIGIKPPAHLH